MNDTTRPRKHPGTSPEWANLPRRKCDNCGHSYKPVRPMRKDERGFCMDNCRKSYHKHGGAYRKLKVEMGKLVTREMASLERRFREIVRGEIKDALEHVQKNAEFTAVVSKPGW